MVDLPNADRLKQLPLRALVAYAVRCAMRVQRLYLKWQDGEAKNGPPTGMVESVAEAIELASRFASQEDGYDLKRGQELEEIVIEAVMRAKNGHRGAAFAANAAYAALNAANIASTADGKGSNRRAEAEKVVLAVITAADAAAAAHEPVIQSAVDDWHALQLMRIGEYPDAGRPVDPRPEGKLGPLFNKKPKPAGWRDQSPTLRQVKKNENVLEQTRQELLFQQEERKKDKAAHEAKCDEYEKTIRHLKAEVIPLRRERDELKKQIQELETEIADLKNQLGAQADEHKNRLTEVANQLLDWARAESENESQSEDAADNEAASVESQGTESQAEKPAGFPASGAEPDQKREFPPENPKTQEEEDQASDSASRAAETVPGQKTEEAVAAR